MRENERVKIQDGLERVSPAPAGRINRCSQESGAKFDILCKRQVPN